MNFKDHYGVPCSLQASSLAIYCKPGTSAVWLGCDDAQPKIMASDAARLGIKTDAPCGWIPYPIPDEVLLSTRMHLNREQVAGLIAHLQSWLDRDTFKAPNAEVSEPGGPAASESGNRVAPPGFAAPTGSGTGRK